MYYFILSWTIALFLGVLKPKALKAPFKNRINVYYRMTSVAVYLN